MPAAVVKSRPTISVKVVYDDYKHVIFVSRPDHKTLEEQFGSKWGIALLVAPDVLTKKMTISLGRRLLDSNNQDEGWAALQLNYRST